MLATAGSSFAQTLTLEQFQNLVAKQIKTDFAQYNLDDLEVNVNRLPVSKLTLPEGKVTVKVYSNSKALVAKEYKKVEIYVNKTYAQTYYVPTEVKAYKYAAVAKEMIQRDKIIPLQAVEVKKVDVTSNLNNTLNASDLAPGLVAGKIFYPGEIITKRFTKSKPDVVKNAIVTVNFKTGSDINIAVEGIALTSGNIGDMIQIKNKRFNKIYTGKVSGTNQVLIQI